MEDAHLSKRVRVSTTYPTISCCTKAQVTANFNDKREILEATDKCRISRFQRRQHGFESRWIQDQYHHFGTDEGASVSGGISAKQVMRPSLLLAYNHLSG